MGWLKWFKRWIFRVKPRATFDREVVKNPLREFIYLDEVSLRSLLSSKKGEMTSTTSTEVSESVEAEVRSSASAGNASVGKAEFGSRFQTRNSSTLQTAKKATVQSWFRELDKIPNLRVVETVQQILPFGDKSEIAACDNRSVSVKAERFERGDVVEFRVRLAADPIFHLVTLVSEFKAMAEDYPSMMNGNGGLRQFEEIEGITRVLQRLLAGLIPVRALVLDYVVVNIESAEYVVHVDALNGLDIDHEPLEVGCVTELDAYWKDIRRVLFSDAEFTMLGRVSKRGLQKTWTPIKLADLLKKFVPDLSKTLDQATRVMFDAGARGAVSSERQPPLRDALNHFVAGFSDEVSVVFTEAQQHEINHEISKLENAGPSISEQSEALKALSKFLSELSQQDIEPQKALELREGARMAANLPYFGATNGPAVQAAAQPDHSFKEERFLDVEVVAMYW